MRLAVAVLSSIALLTASSSVMADWPMARHDPQRTGAATGKSNITAPAKYWRTYLGGKLGSQSLIAADINKDGKSAMVYAAAGKVTAKLPNDKQLWQSAAYGIDVIWAIDDFDGDGNLDVVASSSARVFILDARSGALEWAEADGEMGTIGSVRIGDFDGDKKLDVFVQECGCCAVNSGKTGFVYSFAAGFSAARPLWSLPSVLCGGFFSLALVDLAGDGKVAITLATSNRLSLVDGASGGVLATSDDLSEWIGFGSCVGADLDGVAGDELLCINRAALASPKAHRLVALKYRPATRGLETLWDIDVGTTDGAAFLVPEVVVDLDGDGMREVVAAGKNAGNYVSYVYDAATGAELGSISDERATGTSAIGSDKNPLVLTSKSGTLTAYSFSRASTPRLRALFSIPEATTVSVPDWGKLRTTALSDKTLAFDLNGDSMPDLITYKGLPPKGVDAWSFDGAKVAALGSYSPGSGVIATPTWLVGSVDRSYAQIAVARNDGILTVLDNKLAPTDSKGLTFGGYLAKGGWLYLGDSPVVGRLGGLTDSILVSDSRGALLRLDPKEGTNLSPPVPVWTKTNTIAAAIVPGLDGSHPGIACRGLVEPVTDPPVYQVSALKSDGSQLWSKSFEGLPFGDVLPATINDDSTPDLVFQWGNDSDLLINSRTLSGVDGTPLWSAGPVDPGAGRSPSGYALADWDGDGKTDLIYQALGTRVISGSSGTEIASSGAGPAYFLPIISDVDSDGVLEVTLQGGFNGARTLKHDLKTAVWSGDENLPYPYSAIATCSGTPVLIEGSLKDRSRLRFTQMSGSTAGTNSSIVLAGGKSFVDEAAATAARADLGQLGNTSVHNNLDGSGGSSAVLGSSDGFLYVVDPCAQTLRYSMELGAPVGEVIFGDTDGDGNDEIFTTAADGYLYAVKNATLPLPQNVLDLDPDHGGTGIDVDITFSSTKLTARWDAVAGADKYEVAAAGTDGKLLVGAGWTDVGDVTQASLDKLTLTGGMRYTFAVRAVSAVKGRGPDALSNGVTYMTTAAPDAGQDADASPETDAGSDAGDAGDVEPTVVNDDSSGCGCQLPSSRETGLGSVVLAITALALALRRRSVAAA